MVGVGEDIMEGYEMVGRDRVKEERIFVGVELGEINMFEGLIGVNSVSKGEEKRFMLGMWGWGSIGIRGRIIVLKDIKGKGKKVIKGVVYSLGMCFMKEVIMRMCD